MIPNPGADDDEDDKSGWLLVDGGWDTFSSVDPLLLLSTEVILVRLLVPEEGSKVGEADADDEEGGEAEETSWIEWLAPA